MRSWRSMALLLFLPPALVRAESVQPPNVQTVTVPSEALKSSRKAMVLVPRGYNNSTRRYGVLYLLHGFGGNYEDWFKHSNVVEYAVRYALILVAPDAENSYYGNSLSRPDYQYEDFIVRDLVNYIDSHYRTIANRHQRGIVGLSMGGYGAMKLGLKYPQTYSAIAAFSGTFTRAQVGHKASNEAMAKVLRDIFGADNNPAHQENDPFLLVKKLGPYKPDIYFACGNSDHGPLATNRQFAQLLSSAGISYEYREPVGVHNWEVWDGQIREYLRIVARLWHLDLLPPGPPPGLPGPPPPPRPERPQMAPAGPPPR